MKRSIPMSRLILLGILIPVVMLLTMSSLLIHQHMYATLKGQYQDSAFASMQQNGNEVNRFITDIESTLLGLQNNASINTLVKTTGASELRQIKARRAFIDALNQLLSQKDSLLSVIVVTPDDNIYGASKTRTYSATDPHPYFTSTRFQSIRTNGCTWFPTMDDRYFTDVSIASHYSPSEKVVVCAHKINRTDLELNNCTLLFLIRSSAFTDIFDSFTLPSDNMYLLDAEGNVLWNRNDQPEPLPPEVIARAGVSSSFEAEIDQRQMHVMSASVGSKGWKAMCIVPTSIYTASLNSALVKLLRISLAALCLLMLILGLVTICMIRPLKVMLQAIDAAGQGDLMARMPESFPVREYRQLAHQFNLMMENIYALMEQNQHVAQEKYHMEINALQYQINPHFLFNTLTSIRYLAIMTHADVITSALEHLAALLQPIYHRGSTNWTVQDEYACLQNYIALMDLRFGSRVTCEIRIAPETMEFPIPCFILQPLLENSYEHSVSRHPIHLLLSITLEQGRIFMRIQDDGDGIQPDQLERIRAKMEHLTSIECGHSIGIANVYLRLKLIYGRDAFMSIQSEPGKGTEIEISIALPESSALPSDCSS